MKIIKDIIQKIFILFGYKIINNKNLHLDIAIKKLINVSQPLIFDVGANQGQSIERFKTIFSDCLIHCFEPIVEECKKIKEKYLGDNLVILNNVGLSNTNESLELNITSRSGLSSFKKPNLKSEWAEQRSASLGISKEDFIKKTEKINCIKLDDYCEKNNIEKINILKIDTQGYEDKVLQGGAKLLNNKKIDLIQVEIIHSENYENPLNIYDVEKNLIPNGYKLFAVSNGGNLNTDIIFQQDYIYVSNEIYKNFKELKKLK